MNWRNSSRASLDRPGDAINQTADDIRFGVPAFDDEEQQSYILKQYDLAERLNYKWLFMSPKE